ncbi:uncharacterized protein LOC114334018 [Diabrotica virgifera virgifera]|uniref:Proline-, glutamic acid- and leucine-rich protein 1-like n=1 Tax=Diabrotica virgifera virgifera TaxID=50390 RepID=A0ABM5IRN6_DIAVI|nr:uncharacterized protein LOC114334018 [Diabrotica virgifera virgifera]
MDHKVFEVYLQNGPTDADIKKINTLLSNSKTIKEGLELLNSILIHCSVEFLNENLTNWLDVCLVKHSEHFTDLKLSLIEKFIEASFTNQELAKKISSEYLSKIIDLCLTSKSSFNEIESAFDVLTICMKKFNSCTTHKTRIEAHILSFLESSADWIVEKAAIAYLYLQQTGNAGTKSNNYVTNFKTTLSQLCCTAHNLLDIFFQNKEIEQYTPTSQESPPLEIYTDGDVNLTARSIKNIVTFLSIFIKKEFPVYKEIAPMELLNLIKRCIAIHHCVSENSDNQNSSADYEFFRLHTDIQLDLLSMLRILILWLRSDCLPFAFIISKILLDCLQRSQKCSCFNINCVYLETVYIVLTAYINISKCALNGHFQSEVIKCILIHITPRRNEIALKKQSDDKKESSLKQKSILPKTENSYDLHKSKREIENDEVRCQLALSTLTALFKNSFLRAEKSLIHSVLSLIMNIFNDIICSRIPHPYKSSESQLKLHELLVACCEQETLTDLPLISMTLNILQHSSCSKLNKLAQMCHESLNDLEKICQPISTPFPMFSAQLALSEHSNISENGIELVTKDNVVDLTNDEKSVDSSFKVHIISNDLVYSPDLDLSDKDKSIATVACSDLDRSISIVLSEEGNDNLNKSDNSRSEENNERNDSESDESFEPVLKVDIDNLNKNGNAHSEENNEMNAESDESFEPVSKKSKIERTKSTNSILVSDGCKNNDENKVVCLNSSDIDISFTDDVQDY